MHSTTTTCRPTQTPQRRRSALAALALVVLLFTASGANCNQWVRGYTQPRTLPDAATLDQIVNTVNTNTGKVHALQSTKASLSIPGVPMSLRSTVALETPLRIRMRAFAPLGGGTELDLGSNDEQFWLWIPRNQPPAVFVCRHDQFAGSSARQVIPVEPEWLQEAIGLARIDTTQPVEGPWPVGAGRIKIRSRQNSMLGPLTKDTVVDAWDGTVLEQHLYDAGAHRLATSRTKDYKHDPASGAALPHSIEVEWPTANMSFHLDVTEWVVNVISADPNLWIKPEYPGYPEVNLADPNVQFYPPGRVPVGVPAMPAAAAIQGPMRPPVLPPR